MLFSKIFVYVNILCFLFSSMSYSFNKNFLSIEKIEKKVKINQRNVISLSASSYDVFESDRHFINVQRKLVAQCVNATIHFDFSSVNDRTFDEVFEQIVSMFEMHFITLEMLSLINVSNLEINFIFQEKIFLKLSAKRAEITPEMKFLLFDVLISDNRTSFRRKVVSIDHIFCSHFLKIKFFKGGF